MAYPALYPKEIPIPRTTNPTNTGAKNLGTDRFLSSVIARTLNSKRAVPTIYNNKM